MSQFTICFTINKDTIHLSDELKTLQEKYLDAIQSPYSPFQPNRTSNAISSPSVPDQQHRIDELTSKLEQSKNQILTIEQEKQQQQEEIKNLHHQIAQKDNEIQMLLAQKNSEIKQYTDSLANKETENNTLQNTLIQLQTSLSHSAEINRNQQEELQSLTTISAQDKERARQTQHELQQLNSQISTMRSCSWPKELLAFEEWAIQQQDFVSFFQLEQHSCDANRIKMMVKFGRFGNIEELWKKFMQRCEQETREATKEELRFSKFALDCFNVNEQSQASLIVPDVGSVFTSDQCMDISNKHGQKIETVYFHGLRSIQNDIKRKALVSTTY